MWRELQLLGLPRGLIDHVSARLFALGTAGVQEDHLPGQAPPPRQPWDTGPPPPAPRRVVLRAWFEDPDEPALLDALAGVDAELSWADVPDTDWEQAFRDRFPPVHVTERLTLAPPWNAPPGALIIEPGQGFGTGHHPTTLQALRRFDALMLEAEHGVHSVLDIGCGSGVLALAAARMGCTAHGVDVEPEAVRDAARNALANDLQATFATTAVHDLSEPADLVFGNLHGELLVALAPDLQRLGRRHWIFAGILDDREAMVREAFPALRFVHRDVDGRWVALHGVRA
jgi:ribosomal protein L11 methyltransferase